MLSFRLVTQNYWQEEVVCLMIMKTFHKLPSHCLSGLAHIDIYNLFLCDKTSSQMDEARICVALLK